MPPPILDTGFDRALTQGMGLGLHAKQVNSSLLYRQAALENQLARTGLYAQGLEGRLQNAEDRNQIARDHLDQMGSALQQRDSHWKDVLDQREAFHADQEARKNDTHDALAAQGRSNFQQDNPPQVGSDYDQSDEQTGEPLLSELYKDAMGSAGEQWAATPAYDRGRQQTERYKAARAAKDAENLDRTIAGMEAVGPDKWPEGPDIYNRKHMALWVKRDNLHQSVNSMMGPARKGPAADPAAADRDFQQQVQDFNGEGAFKPGTLRVLHKDATEGKHIPLSTWRAALVDPSQVEGGNAKALQTMYGSQQRMIGALERELANLPYDASIADADTLAQKQGELQIKLDELRHEADATRNQLETSQRSVGKMRGTGALQNAPAPVPAKAMPPARPAPAPAQMAPAPVTPAPAMAPAASPAASPAPAAPGLDANLIARLHQQYPDDDDATILQKHDAIIAGGTNGR